MSVTRQEPVSRQGWGMLQERTGLWGTPLITTGKIPPRPGAEAVPLRELIDDRLLDALLERSKDEAGGLRLTGEGSMLGRAGQGGSGAGAGCRADRAPWL